METHIVKGSITEIGSDALIVNLFENVTSPGGATGAVDTALGGMITELIQSKEITGKKSECTLIHTHGKITSKRILIVGLGKADKFDSSVIRKVAGTAIRFLNKRGIRTVSSIVHGAGIGGLSPRDAARAVVEGTLLGMYRGDIYKARDEDYSEVESFTIVEMDDSKIADIQAGANEGRILAEATNDARDLGNEPSNKMTPTILAQRAKEMADRFGLEYEEFDEKQMGEIGMGALLSVSQGSIQPPRLIILRYKAGDDKPTAAFVGKGLTFDSGGISIKPQEGMHMMKYDMSGGAAVVHAMRAVAELKPNINVLGLIPASENMPSGSAFRPGDVLTSFGGKTIEVITTDAEGRLLLADAMTYAVREGADYIVDIATLTGSCAIALGNDITGVMGNDRELIDHVAAAAKSAGEQVWELPLPPEYMDQLKSPIADLKNAGTRYGGALTAGLFLKEFAEDTPWVHMDIAGTAYSPKGEPSSNGHMATGATGVGVRTLAMLAFRLADCLKTGGTDCQPI